MYVFDGYEEEANGDIFLSFSFHGLSAISAYTPLSIPSPACSGNAFRLSGDTQSSPARNNRREPDLCPDGESPAVLPPGGIHPRRCRKDTRSEDPPRYPPKRPPLHPARRDGRQQEMLVKGHGLFLFRTGSIVFAEPKREFSIDLPTVSPFVPLASAAPLQPESLVKVQKNRSSSAPARNAVFPSQECPTMPARSWSH